MVGTTHPTERTMSEQREVQVGELQRIAGEQDRTLRAYEQARGRLIALTAAANAEALAGVRASELLTLATELTLCAQRAAELLRQRQAIATGILHTS